MRTLSRYWLARFLGFFALVILTGALVLFAVELLIGLGRAAADSTESGDTASPILAAALRIPAAYASYLVPISAYTAAFLCTTLAARWREVLAAQASGIPPARLLAPLLVAAIALAAGFALFQETLSVRAARALEHATSGDTSLHFQSGAVWVQRGPVLYSVDSAHPEEGRLEGVRVLERDPSGHVRRLIRAREVRIDEPGRWYFRDALIRSFDTRRRSRLPTVQTADEIELEIGGERDLALLAARFDSLSLRELSETIAMKRSAGARFHRALAAMHGRVADAAAILALAIVGFGLGLLAVPSRGFGLPSTLAVTVLILYYATRGAGQTLARTEVLPAGLATWGVVGLWLVIGAVLVARRPD